MAIFTKSCRLIEITLWVLGISLLGTAFGETFDRWQYQKQQERALFQREPVTVGARASSPALPVVAEERADEDTGARKVVVVPKDAGEETRAPKVVPAKKKAPARDPLALGRIEIPAVGVRAIVKDGIDDKTLSRAVGRLPASARPGERGNMVLAGHRDTFFYSLKDIEVNDRVRLVTPDETYEYRVQSVMIVEPKDVAVLESKGFEELTLVTCYPFSFVGPAPDRFVVTAARVN